MKDFEETIALQVIADNNWCKLWGEGDKERDMFCGKIFDKTANEYDYLNKIVFSYEATFHLSGKFNRQNVRTWGTENPHGNLNMCGTRQN